MPESVDRPAPERTTTSPSATRSASASMPGPATAVGTAVTGPSSLAIVARAAGSAGGQLGVQPLEDLVVHAAQALGRERALEEAADAAGPVPGRPDPHRRAPR